MGKERCCHAAECCETVEVHEELLEIVKILVMKERKDEQ